jgi:hypothetical protein
VVATIRTPENRADFLLELAESGNVGKAAARAGVGRTTVYEWREADPDFAEQWARAEKIATSLLEDEAFRRAHDGVEKPVYQNGEQVGAIREYSDTLMIFLLKARDKRYRDANRQVEADDIATAKPDADTRNGALAALERIAAGGLRGHPDASGVATERPGADAGDDQPGR